MTGKYMKPLLALGAEDESETWAVQLRRDGGTSKPDVSWVETDVKLEYERTGAAIFSE
mgnify:CR=1 FL=1